MQEEDLLIQQEDLELSPYDAVEFLTEDRDFSLFLKISFEENGFKGLQEALVDVAKAKTINDLAKKTGIPREEVYKLFTQNLNPPENMLNKILEVLAISNEQ